MKRFLIMFLMAFVLGGCAATPKAPMDKLFYPSSDKAQARNLIVFLKGLGASHHSFERYGFVEAVQRRHLSYDMVTPDAHYGYYINRSLIQRLQEDIIEPAREHGYENIWLVGISMGGLGSVLYHRERTLDLDGIIIIAPFLGYDGILREITSAGGLPAWRPGDYNTAEDWQRMLWHWLQHYSTQNDQLPPIYLGYGRSDTYVKGQGLLASVLPQDQVVEISGGHDLRTFQEIWDIYLDKNVLP